MTILPGLFLVLVAAGSWAALPYDWEACKQGTATFDNCLLKQINKAVQDLKGGSKQLAVNPLDPLKILNLKIDQGSGPVSIKLEWKDTDMSGLSSCELHSYKNFDWKRMEGKGFCKRIDWDGYYKIDGKVLTFPIKGEGKGKFVMEEVTVGVDLSMKETEKNGNKHFEVTAFQVDLDPKKASYDFQNLFNGNKALGDTTNKFLNENGVEIFKEIGPSIKRALSQGFAHISNQVFSKIPSNEINIK